MSKTISALSVLLISTLLTANALARDLTVEVARSPIPMHGMLVQSLVTLSTDDGASCPAVCYGWGGHAARVATELNHYALAGADGYAWITGGPLRVRWGFGVSVFDRQTDELRNPWDFHISIQTTYHPVGQPYGVFATVAHWSNARRLGEALNLMRFWPDSNDGGDAVLIGVAYSFGVKP